MTGCAYHRPTSLEEAWSLRAETSGSRFIAGGTDLIVQMRKRLVGRPEALISLRSIPELAAITGDGEFRIGPLVTLRDLLEHSGIRESFPDLCEAARVIGSIQIRNVATLGGNLCNASPAADLAPPLLVREARVELASPGGKRQIPLERFFLGPGQTALKEGELLTAVIISPPPPAARAVFIRKGRVRMDLAIASVSAALEQKDGVCRNVRLAAGAVAPVPLRLSAVEGLLEGKTLTDDLLEQAGSTAAGAVSPITDVRSTAEHRRRLVGVFVKRALRRLISGDGEG